MTDGVKRIILASTLMAATIGIATAQTPSPPAATAPAPATTLVIDNVRVFDGRSAKLRERAAIVIASDRVVAIVDAGSATVPPTARRIDGGNRVAIPGLIDAHAHPSIPVALSTVRDHDPNYVAVRGTHEARAMLLRGFTSVRDMGGPAFGLRQAIDEGLVPGPRIFPSGAIVSQTSGHGDFRNRTGEPRRWSGDRDASERLGYGLIADGTDEVLAAVREQLRAGATQVKLAAGGGISSEFDPLDSVQYLDAELRAAVQAAADWGTYVAVHAYTPEAIRRSVLAGVRSIEHGHLIDEPTMQLIAERGVFLSAQAYLFSGIFAQPTPTPPPPNSRQAKGQQVATGLDRMMQLAKKHNVKVAFGTDVFGGPRAYALQSKEFSARLKWFTPIEILRQATSVNGELLALSGPRYPYPGPVGVLAPGAMADVLLVDGNPLEDIALLDTPERTLPLIVKNGAVIRELPTP